MAEDITEKHILIRSRLAPGYELSEMGRKNLQHVLTDWIPRVIYADLTADTASVDVDVIRDMIVNKSQFRAAFKRSDGTVVKNASYAEDRVIGVLCHNYEPKKAKYEGSRDGYDCRLVYYTDAMAKTIPMPRAR